MRRAPGGAFLSGARAVLHVSARKAGPAPPADGFIHGRVVGQPFVRPDRLNVGGKKPLRQAPFAVGEDLHPPLPALRLTAVLSRLRHPLHGPGRGLLRTDPEPELLHAQNLIVKWPWHCVLLLSLVGKEAPWSEWSMSTTRGPGSFRWTRQESNLRQGAMAPAPD